VGVDAEQGVGVGVADPDRARADRQPAAVNGLGAAWRACTPWLAAGSMRCSSPPLASTHTPPAPAATAPGQMLAVQADGGGYPAAGRVDPGQGGVATLTQNEPAPKAAPAGAPPRPIAVALPVRGSSWSASPRRRRGSRPRRRLRLHPQGRSPRRSLGRRAGHRYRLPWRRRNDLGCRNPPSTQRERNAALGTRPERSPSATSDRPPVPSPRAPTPSDGRSAKPPRLTCRSVPTPAASARSADGPRPPAGRGRSLQ
jgi:hypothetical protein